MYIHRGACPATCDHIRLHTHKCAHMCTQTSNVLLICLTRWASVPVSSALCLQFPHLLSAHFNWWFVLCSCRFPKEAVNLNTSNWLWHLLHSWNKIANEVIIRKKKRNESWKKIKKSPFKMTQYQCMYPRSADKNHIKGFLVPVSWQKTEQWPTAVIEMVTSVLSDAGSFSR